MPEQLPEFISDEEAESFFNEDAESPDVIPEQDAESLLSDEPNQYSQGEAALRAVGQTASFGMADEAMAGAKSLYGEYVEGQPSTYDQRKIEEDKAMTDAAGQWPKTDMAASAATGIGMSAIPGVGAAKGVKLLNYLKNLSRMKKAAAVGGAYGAGHSKEGIMDNPLGLAKDAAIGAGTGMAVDKGMQFGGEGLKRAAGSLKAAGKAGMNKARDATSDAAEWATEVAQEKAVKAASGGQSISHLRDMGHFTQKVPGDSRDAMVRIRKTGQDLLDAKDSQNRNVLRAGSRIEDTGPRISDQLKHHGKKIGEVGKIIDDYTPKQRLTKDVAISTSGLKRRIKKKIRETRNIGEGEGYRAALEKFDDRIDTEWPEGKMKFSDLQELKSRYLKYNIDDKTSLVTSKSIGNDLTHIVTEEMDAAADKVGKKLGEIPTVYSGGPKPKGGSGAGMGKVSQHMENLKLTPTEGKKDLDSKIDILKRYRENRGKYQSFKNLESAGTDRIVKEQANRSMSPSDYGAMGIGTAAGAGGFVATGDPVHLAWGFLATAANKLARGRGNSTTARSMNSIGKTLDKIANVGRNNPDFTKKYAEKLKKAGEAGNGGASIAATHQILMRRPDYKAFFESEENNDN